MPAWQARSTKRYLIPVADGNRRANNFSSESESSFKLYGIATGDGSARVGTMLNGLECEFKEDGWYINGEPVFYIFFVDNNEIHFLG